MLSSAENVMIVFSLVWTKHRNVTDRRTNRQTDRQLVAITAVGIANNADVLNAFVGNCEFVILQIANAF